MVLSEIKMIYATNIVVSKGAKDMIRSNGYRYTVSYLLRTARDFFIYNEMLKGC